MFGVRLPSPHMTNHEFLRIFPEKFIRRTTMQCTRAGWVVTRE